MTTIYLCHRVRRSSRGGVLIRTDHDAPSDDLPGIFLGLSIWARDFLADRNLKTCLSSGTIDSNGNTPSSPLKASKTRPVITRTNSLIDSDRKCSLSVQSLRHW